jgi:prepilin-type N-terminal cleavage/methylation domain-containing protein
MRVYFLRPATFSNPYKNLLFIRNDRTILTISIKRNRKGARTTMFKNLKKNEGFTIIEVLIVLAIAGLIMLIVFLAVPALQRNSRNTQRKNDVSGLLGAVSEYQNNNAGKLPDAWNATSTEFRKTGATTGTKVNLGIYAGTDVDYNANSNAAVTPALGRVFVRGGAKCNPAGDNFGGANATSRSVAIVYGVEQSGAPTYVCQES